MDYNDIKILYEEISEITSAIATHAKAGENDEIEELLDKRGRIINRAQKAYNNTAFSDEEKAYLNSLFNKIKTTENTVIALFNIKKDEISKELVTSSKTSKLLTAYSIKTEEPQSQMFDASQ